MVIIECSGGITTTKSVFMSKVLQLFYEVRLKAFYINGNTQSTAVLSAWQNMSVELKKPSTQQKSNHKNSSTIFSRLSSTKHFLGGPYKQIWAISPKACKTVDIYPAMAQSAKIYSNSFMSKKRTNLNKGILFVVPSNQNYFTKAFI